MIKTPPAHAFSDPIGKHIRTPEPHVHPDFRSSPERLRVDGLISGGEKSGRNFAVRICRPARAYTGTAPLREMEYGSFDPVARPLHDAHESPR